MKRNLQLNLNNNSNNSNGGGTADKKLKLQPIVKPNSSIPKPSTSQTYQQPTSSTGGSSNTNRYRGGGGDDEEEEEEEDDDDEDDDDEEEEEEEGDVDEYEDIDIMDEDLSQDSSQQLQFWSRKAAAELTPHKKSFIFQQLEVDYAELKEPVPGMPGPKKGPLPVIRMFGITKEGNSVLCKVHGFLPYFFIQCPPGFTSQHCKSMKDTLNEQMIGYYQRDKDFEIGDIVISIDIIQKKSIMFYNNDPLSDFIMITLIMPKYVTRCRETLENMSSRYIIPGQPLRSYVTYESNIPFALRFLIDKNIAGCSWIELPATTYQESATKVSTCQYEIDTSIHTLITHSPDSEGWSDTAPFRILSFDIECAGRKGFFPEPEKDPVIQIANVVKHQGEQTPFIKNIFTLKSCSSIVGAHVLSYETERELLREWRKFIVKLDPDIIIGYNIANFDLPYLINRARTLKVNDFALLGRIKTTISKIKTANFSSKNLGSRESKEISMPGRTQLDMIQAIQRDHKLSSYSLNNVSAHFLKEQKEDVHFSIISDLQNGTDDDRRRLAVYCLKDAMLPLKLLDKLMILINYVEMSRVTGVPLSYLLGRGESVKVLSQLYRKAMKEDYVLPTYKVNTKGEKFQGAVVIEPKSGFYNVPIATLDFTSLYPSIMMAHNLCYSTLIPPDQAKTMSPDEYTHTPSGDYFALPSLKKGLLPRILEELLGARKKAKDDLKNESDPFKKAVLDGRQLALKISANSVYGFTGARVGKLPCIEISRSVTSFGRVMLNKTQEIVEGRYTVANGYSHNATIIYGDTDSVMVKFGVETVEEAMQLGREASKEVTKHFIRPINLDFEKVYYPYLLMSKKKYAGLFWTKPNTWDKMDVKGLEMIRRDTCPLVRNVVGNVLKKLLIERNVQAAEDYVKSVVSDLLQGRLDISMLVITKALSKSEYKSRTVHNELAQRMRARNPATAPNLGDRVPYVVIQATKGTPIYEKAEDPLYVLEHNKLLDTQYYCDKQLKGPIDRIFKPIKNSTTSLFVGEHTRVVAQSSMSSTNKGFFGTLEKKRVCMNCPNELLPNEQTVCKNCRHKESDLYLTTLENVGHLETKFANAWTHCQRCSGSLMQPVLCSNRDCPIFYMRTKVQKDLIEAKNQLARFDVDW
ncbi:DNA polymerase delta catalytic subunit [Tieghemostelium lacteum]|uniref:DNA polymerase n=1 Tax=Tieghemostelium lacteum TaxID=361077 RepID=A0A151ZRV5_TIELA|nr:DNA polymerase delta catalytic subunit [Tieghemostelium lacteum]|eukprot:KYQ96665.1 DNA polymerase delta catalytic subunit [Tieghemostelium lacteum]